MRTRLLGPEDLEQSWELSRLAFGGDPDAAAQPRPPGYDVGTFDERGRLVARALSRPYQQWWGGRRVPMAGLAAVAVRPENRGQGLVRQLLEQVVREATQPISVLFPTASRIYRGMGWEVVGTLDDTAVPLSALPQRRGAPVRAATPDDLPAMAALYDARGATTPGFLTRTGPSFDKGTEAIFDHEVVSVAVEDGQVTGYVAYDRGRGYQSGGQLRVWECICSTPGALTALVTSVASWSSVAESALWRGSTRDLALLLDSAVPPPTRVQPWMLAVLDPVAAVAARGFGPVNLRAEFALADKGFRLEVADGRGELSEVSARDLPVVTPGGLALLYAGVGQHRLLRNGFVDQPVPALEEAFAGAAPEILDYF